MNEASAEVSNFLSSLKMGSTIALDGYSGIGKTTISNEVTKTNDSVLVLHMDDYVVTANKKEALEPQIKNNDEELKLMWADVEGRGFAGLEKDIKNNKGKIVLVEGIFFSHPEILPGVFSEHIFLDGDEEKADQRRVREEKELWGDKYLPETHPDSFVRLFKLAWCKYRELYKPEEKADLVVEV